MIEVIQIVILNDRSHSNSHSHMIEVIQIVILSEGSSVNNQVI